MCTNSVRVLAMHSWYASRKFPEARATKTFNGPVEKSLIVPFRTIPNYAIHAVAVPKTIPVTIVHQ